jgi:hypothetical protein
MQLSSSQTPPPPSRRRGFAPFRPDRALARVAAALLSVALLLSGRLGAQAVAPHDGSVIEYSRNESGGRIRVVSAERDSARVERIRLALLEAAAAIRRGDLRPVWVLPQNPPALALVADRRDGIRCTYRPLPAGGEIVLLGHDNATVAAIHRLLAPERAAR